MAFRETQGRRLDSDREFDQRSIRAASRQEQPESFGGSNGFETVQPKKRASPLPLVFVRKLTF